MECRLRCKHEKDQQHGQPGEWGELLPTPVGKRDVPALGVA